MGNTAKRATASPVYLPGLFSLTSFDFSFLVYCSYEFDFANFTFSRFFFPIRFLTPQDIIMIETVLMNENNEWPREA